jgi:hypothetical protein
MAHLPHKRRCSGFILDACCIILHTAAVKIKYITGREWDALLGNGSESKSDPEDHPLYVIHKMRKCIMTCVYRYVWVISANNVCLSVVIRFGFYILLGHSQSDFRWKESTFSALSRNFNEVCTEKRKIKVPLMRKNLRLNLFCTITVPNNTNKGNFMGEIVAFTL